MQDGRIGHPCRVMVRQILNADGWAAAYAEEEDSEVSRQPLASWALVEYGCVDPSGETPHIDHQIAVGHSHEGVIGMVALEGSGVTNAESCCNFVGYLRMTDEVPEVMLERAADHNKICTPTWVSSTHFGVLPG